MKRLNPFLTIDRRILGDSGTSGELERCLDMLCNSIGPRFAGTEGYRQAAEFMLGRFRAYGMDRAYLEEFEFIAWRRGAPATLAMLKPGGRAYECYELPYSAATGPQGLKAEIVDIGSGSAEAIKKVGARVSGGIVLTDGSSGHRSDIFRRAVIAGATGFVLSARVKGEGCVSGTVHDARHGRVPAVSVSFETGLRMRRALARGRERFRLVTNGHCEKDRTWNVVGELKGVERSDEVVIMGGHLDSHEIGCGAYDNAAGAVTVMEAARLLAKEKKHLKRTVRFIGFAAEEIGLLGSKHHAAKHLRALGRTRFMLNSDCPGMGRPKGLCFHKSMEAECYVASVSRQIETPLIYRRRFLSHSDHYPFMRAGVTTASIIGGKFAPAIQHCGHMAGDTADKISITDLRESAALAALMLLRASSDEDWLKPCGSDGKRKKK